MSIGSWINSLLDRGVMIKKSWLISWPDASGDRCQVCNIRRWEHDAKIQKHEFKEE